MSVQATTTVDAVAVRSRPMSREEKRVILASSLGTVFEWYDFYLYGSLAAIIGAQFFSQYPEATRNVFALLAFAAGFLVRPFGALVFGRLGDLVGRKYTFLITILIMGGSTFLVGCLPSYETIGFIAPVVLIALRMAQGLALGGEYGGAAIYVAEHAPPGKRGFFTSWIQTTATLGLLLSLIIIMFTQIYVNANYPEVVTAAGAKLTPFAAWGWRIPFLVSIAARRRLGVDPHADGGEPNRFRSIFIMPRVDPQGSAVGRNFFDVKECQPVSSEDFLDRPKGQVRKMLVINRIKLISFFLP